MTTAARFGAAVVIERSRSAGMSFLAVAYEVDHHLGLGFHGLSVE